MDSGRRPGGPTAMARKIEDRLTDAHAEREVAETRQERSRLNKEIHRLEDLLRWCKSRAGYDDTRSAEEGSANGW